MSDKSYDIHNEFRIPSGKEYEPSMATSIRRCYSFTIQDGKACAATNYYVDGMRYKVNSIFDLINAPSSDEGLKKLMIDEADKAS